MRQFSFGGACSQGLRFFSPQAVNHAIILLGLGVVAPYAVQYLLAGGPTPLANPAMIGGSALDPNAISGIAGIILIAMLAAYVCNFGAMFGSLRLGLGGGETLPGAVIYGVITAILVAVAMFLILGGAVFLGIRSGGAATSVVLVMIIIAAFLLFFAVLYPVFVAIMCLFGALALLLVLATGASLPGADAAAQLNLGGGVFIMLAVTLIIFWLTARLSCTTAAMAQRGTYNPLTGMAESWRLTAANQWRILGYLSLLGLLMLIVLFVIGGVVGASMMSSMQSGTVPTPGAGTMVGSMVMGALFLYFSVMVPAGIYRELVPSASAAEAFR